MGYETKLIVGNKFENGFIDQIAILNLCGMPNEFFKNDIFKNEIKNPIYVGGQEVGTDYYGKKICYAPVKEVLKVLYACEVEEHYRRTEIAINTLKSFLSEDWKDCDIVVLNFGY